MPFIWVLQKTHGNLYLNRASKNVPKYDCKVEAYTKKKVEISSQNLQKWSPNLPKIVPNSMPKLGSRKSRKKWRSGFLPDSFRLIDFWQKSNQNPSSCDLFTIFGIQKGIRKSMPKKYGESMPKGSQNETNMDAKTIKCSYFFKKGENVRNYLFYNIKPGLVLAIEKLM